MTDLDPVHAAIQFATTVVWTVTALLMWTRFLAARDGRLGVANPQVVGATATFLTAGAVKQVWWYLAWQLRALDLPQAEFMAAWPIVPIACNVAIVLSGLWMIRALVMHTVSRRTARLTIGAVAVTLIGAGAALLYVLGGS